MNISSLTLLFLCLWAPISIAGPFAKEANDNPFLNGELNPKYVGELSALAGKVIEIKTTHQKYPVYKLDLKIKGIKNIWVSSIAANPNGDIKVGDNAIFKGYITISSELDPKGELEKITNSKTLLLAIKFQLLN